MSDDVKFRVKRDAESRRREIFFDLVEKNDAIVLKTYDAAGAWLKDILTIENDGTLIRHTGARTPGIQTDDLGRIVLEN